MAPTTMLGQKTSTTPYGRDFRGDGYPIRMAELLAGLEGTAYSARVAVSTPAQIRKAKESVRKAFEMQIAGWSLDRRIPLHLPDELGDEAAGGAEAGARGDVGIFSARRIQGAKAGGHLIGPESIDIIGLAGTGDT